MATSRCGALFVLLILICISQFVVEGVVGLPQAAPCRGRKCSCFERIGLQCPISKNTACTFNGERKCRVNDDCRCPQVCCTDGPTCRSQCVHGIGYPPPRD